MEMTTTCNQNRNKKLWWWSWWWSWWCTIIHLSIAATLEDPTIKVLSTAVIHSNSSCSSLVPMYVFLPLPFENKQRPAEDYSKSMSSRPHSLTRYRSNNFTNLQSERERVHVLDLTRWSLIRWWQCRASSISSLTCTIWWSCLLHPNQEWEFSSLWSPINSRTTERRSFLWIIEAIKPAIADRH